MTSVAIDNKILQERFTRRGGVLLISCYELGHQPLNLASPMAHLRAAGFHPVAVDTSIEIAKPDDGGPNTLTVRKMKGGPEGAVHRFRLKQIPIGVDGEGEAITSCVVEPADDQPGSASRGRRAKPLSREARLALRALHDALNDHGEPAPGSLQLPHGLKVVKREFWRGRLVAALVDPDEDVKGDKIRQRLRRVRVELEDARVIAHSEPYFWIVREPSA